MTVETVARAREALAGIDLDRAEGRARPGGEDGRLGTILAEIERAAPGAILRSAARVQLRALGLSGDAP